MPSIDLATFKAKREQNKEGPRNLLQEKTTNTARQIRGDLMAASNTSISTLIDDFSSAITYLNGTDEAFLQRGLNNVGDLRKDLRVGKGSKYQQFKEFAMGQGVSEADFFEMLHDLDKTYELNLKIEQLDPAYPEEYRIKTEAKKKAAPAPQHVAGAVNSWASFANANKLQGTRFPLYCRISILFSIHAVQKKTEGTA